jgi:hypothetical protein
MNKQAIVSLIKKMGQGLEEAPGLGGGLEEAPGLTKIGPTPSGGLEEAPGVTRIGPGGVMPGTVTPPSANALHSIKVMQQALVDLARDVMQQLSVQNIAQPGQQAGQAAGRNAFGDFITKNYLANSDVPGVEFNPDANAQYMAQKQPTEPSKLNVVMDTMRRIGDPKTGEFAVDGKWGPRTNAALHNAYAYGFALLKLAGDFHFQPTSYTPENLAAFRGEIPAEYTDFDLTQKVDAAPDAAKQIEAIRKLFGEVKTHILEKPAYRAYIEGDQPLHTYTKPGSAYMLDPKAIDSMSQQFNTRLRVSLKTPNGGWVNQPITVNDLTSLDALKKWQQAHAPQAPLPTILNSLKSNLDMMDGNHPVSAEQPVQRPQQPQPTHRQHNRRRQGQ